MNTQGKAAVLPDYERPPIVETVLGVQFDALPEFKNAHLGAFWKSLEPEGWPSVYDAPPLEPQFERFSETGGWSKSSVELRLAQTMPSRLQIKNEPGDQMIQVQNGRLHFNWLGQAGGQYPRWPEVREGFSDTLSHFIEFVSLEQLGDFHANQWEVTYLNHIPKGSVWLTPDDWGFFNLLSRGPKVHDLIQAESFSGTWQFIIPEKRGRLHIQWQHGLRTQPQEEEVVILTLTARGPLPQGPDGFGAILQGLDLGHETIVRSFAIMMTDPANEHWGLKHASL
jgi:uncharacterized protein (TIGR04255 family)